MRRPLRIGDAVLMAATLAVYLPALTAGLFPWDDADYLSQARGSRTLSDLLTRSHLGNYHPLTMLSLHLCGLLGNGAAWVQHAFNILLHVASSLVVVRIARKLVPDDLAALAVALLFALHPAQVESVAWIAERKNVLYALFYLLAILRYIAWLDAPSRSRYVQVVVFFVLALLSKGQAITLPFALIGITIIHQRTFSIGRTMLPLLPFFALSIAFGGIAIWAQGHHHYLHTERTGDVLRTIVLACYAFCGYILHLVVPIRLSVFYPFPHELTWVHYAAIAGTLACATFLVRCIHRSDHLAAGCVLFFALDLFPLLQWVPMGEALMADRHAYVASFPLFLLIVSAVRRWIPGRNKLLGAAFVAIAGTLGIMTYRRAAIWSDRAELFAEAVRYHPQSDIAQYNLAAYYRNHASPDPAAVHFAEVVRLEPNYAQAWYGLGSVQRERKQYTAAIGSFGRAIAAAPDHPNTFLSYYERALCEKELGRPDRALADITQVLRTAPRHAAAYYLKGMCLAMTGDQQAAVQAYDAAERFGYDPVPVRMNRAISYGWLGDNARAIHDLDRVIHDRSTDASAFFLRGIAKQRSGLSGCADLARSKDLGYPRAAEAMAAYCR